MIKGEYWITDTGIEYADGDIGDYNHEMLVIQAVRYILLDAIETEPERDIEFLDKDTFISTLKNELINDDNQNQDIEKLLTEKLIELEQQDKLNHIPIALEKGDPRYWAMENLGWCRIKNNSATVWQINKDTLNLIKDGISEILAIEYDEYDEDDEDTKKTNLTISSAKTNRSYNINWLDLESGNIEFSNTNYIFEAKRNDQVYQMDKALEPKCYKTLN